MTTKKKRSGRKRPRHAVVGLSPTQRQRCLRRWRGWALRIKSEVGDLLSRRQIFVGVRAVLQLNPAVGEPRALISWMMRNYVEAVTVGVRRLCDHRDDVESLSHLLRQLLQHPGVLSFEFHAGLYPARFRHAARATFDLHAGVGRRSLSPRALRRELRQIEDASARIQRFVNKKVAHAAPRRDLRRGPTYGQLSNALKVLDEVAIKYVVLLTGDGFTTCAPVRQYDWRRVLIKPWLTPDDLRHLGAP